MKRLFLLGFCLFFLINISFANTYYWVGNTGNWSDINHWATSSGGTTFYGSLPTTTDDVIFDANSFTSANQVVTINVTQAYCKSMDWTGAKFKPTLTGSTAVAVFGSFILIKDMNYSFKGTIDLQGTGALQFTTLGFQMDNTINFNTTATWNIDGLNLMGKVNCNGANSKYIFSDAVKIVASSTFNCNGILNIIGDNSNCEFKKNVSVDELNCTAKNGIVNFRANVTDGAISLQGESSQMTVEQPITLSGGFDIGYGTFTTNNFDISCTYFRSQTSNTRSLQLGTSNFQVVSDWKMTSTNLTFNMTNNTITVPYSALQPNTVFVFIGGNGLKYNNLEIKVDTISTLTTSNNIFKNVFIKYNTTIDGNSIYENLELQGNATINANNTIDNLKLAAGKEYIFKQSSIQTINKSLSASGNCKNYIYLSSSEKEKQATIQGSATVVIDYSIIQDMNAIGTFTANNSVDVRDNTGWVINPLTSQNLYWVGGSGKWNNEAHWSYTSGGVGGACIPSPVDNVFFDANSFSTTANDLVSVDVANAFCSNMTWSESTMKPKFYVPKDTVLNIYGSLKLIEKMDFDVEGLTNFEAQTKGNTITMAKQKFAKSVNFKGIDGAWTFLDAFTTSLDLMLINGTLNTNSQDVICSNFYSNTTNKDRTLILGSSDITVTSTWNVSSDKFTLDAGTSHIFVQGISMYSGDNQTYYDVTFQISTTPPNFYGSNSIYHDVIFEVEGTIQNTNKIIHYLQFLKNGTVLGVNTFNIIELTPNYTYKFEMYKTQTIKEKMIAVGGCSGLVNLCSTVTGGLAKFESKVVISIAYVTLKDIETNKKSNFIINHLKEPKWADVEYYWTISNVDQGRKLYWVGRGSTSNWSDPNNWSLSSGGIEGECIPTFIDDVFFDKNSFSGTSNEVIIDLPIAECKTMDWTGANNNPIISPGTENTALKIYGSFILTSAMDWEYTNSIYFKSGTTDNHIKTAGNKLTTTSSATVIFQNPEGVWQLDDDFNATRIDFGLSANDYLEGGGTLISNNHSIWCNKFISLITATSVLDLGSSSMSIGTEWTTQAAFKLIQTKSTITFLYSGALCSIAPLEKTTFNTVRFLNDGTLIVKNFDATSACAFNTVVFEKVGITNLYLYNSINNLTFNGVGTLASNEGTFGEVVFNSTGTINLLKTAYTLPASGDNTFRHVIMYGNGQIGCANTYDTLFLSSDRIYTLKALLRQSINKLLSAEGNRCGQITLKSDDTDNEAYFYSQTAKILGYYLMLTNVNTQGNTVFYAGGESQKIKNSQNWTLGDPPGYIFGLSKTDIIATVGEIVTIDTKSFNGNNATIYTWNDGVQAAVRAVNQAGKYKVTAVYGNTPYCAISDQINIYVVEPKNISCYGSKDGSITIKTDTNPVNLYSFSINGTATQQTTTNLVSGDYNIVVTDLADYVTAQRKVTITEPSKLVANAGADYTTTCFNEFVYAAFDAQGGTPPYLIYLDNSTQPCGTSPLLSTNINHTIKVVDSQSCTATDEVKINTPSQIVPAFLQTKQPNCSNTNEGEVNLSATGGTSPYNFFVDGTQTLTTLVSNLSALRTYAIKVVDSNSCESTMSLQITAPPAIQISFQQTKSPKCYNSSDGEITLTASGGVPQYSFYVGDLTTPAPSLWSAQLPYNVFVKDSKGCTNSTEVQLTAPSAVTLTFDKVQNVECSLKGELTLSAKGGTSPYRFYLNDEVNSRLSPIQNLDAQTFRVYVLDNNNCEASNQVTLTETAPLLLTVNLSKELKCYGNSNAELQLMVSGGKTPYSYFIDNQTTTTIISNLSAKNYQVKVVDNTNCTTTSTIEITSPTAIQSQFDVLNLCDGATNGQATANISGGTNPYQLLWDNSENSQEATAKGLLANRDYHLTVTDANTCISTFSVRLASSPSIDITSQLQSNLLCYNDKSGSIQITAQGGSNLTYILNNETNENGYFSGLNAGIQTITIKDVNNCQTALDFTLTQPDELKITIVDTANTCVGCNKGKIDYQISGGTPTYTEKWTNQSGTQVTDLHSLKADTYTLVATDKNSCVAQKSVVISEFKPIIEIPNVFTPNGDNRNDLFKFIKLVEVASFKAIVYNRWGEKIYEWSDKEGGWNGKVLKTNREAVAGVYYLFVDYVGNDGRSGSDQQMFYLVR